MSSPQPRPATPRTMLGAIVALGISFVAAHADVRLPTILGSGMVVQQDSEMTIWGWADAGEQVTVHPSWDKPQTTAAGQTGEWNVTVHVPSAKAAAGPQSIKVSARNAIDLKDILIGEVWVCSGQSNMEMFVSNDNGVFGGVDRWQEEVKNADLPKLRLFDVANAVTAAPQSDCRGSWARCTPDRAKTFSATAFFFGRKLLQELDVPVGLISSDWGGTPAEAWTTRDGLRDFPEFAKELENVAKLRDDPAGVRRAGQSVLEQWRKALDGADEGCAQADRGWMSPAFDDSSWGTMKVPAKWSGDLGNFDGMVWCRREFTLPEGAAGKDAILSLGPIDDCDSTWLNGVKVGETLEDGQWRTARMYAVPAGVLKAGRNVIAVRVLDTAGDGGIYGTPEDLVLKIAALDVSPVALAGEWKYRAGHALSGLPPRPPMPAVGPWTPTALYNGMIAPLTPLSIRGVIWYQGESNCGRAYQYRTLFPAMIADWRRQWKRGDFPFYFVQIAPFRYGNDAGQAAELREAQTMALSVPHTGMAVTMDIGNATDIHPRNKQEVGRRLALAALHETYGRSDECFGPMYRSMSVEGSRVKLTFDHSAGGLLPADQPLSCFTIAGADHVFVPASAKVESGAVVVWSDQVKEPKAVRFGWGAADMPNLKNSAGLPAPSFRTDDWECVTKPKPPAK